MSERFAFKNESLRTPLDSLSQTSRAVTPTPSYEDYELLDTLEVVATLMASAMVSISSIRAVMPSPATLGTAPYFKGENITDFLESWDNFADDYDCVGAEKQKKILRYVDSFYRDEIRIMIKYAKDDKSSYDEQAFCGALKKKYRDTDDEYLKGGISS
jgi:hypothetical protein